MGDLHDIVDYKASKIFINDLSKVISTLEDTIKKLEPYIRYQPVLSILNTSNGLRDCLVTCKSYRDFYKEVINTKGKK